jgi:hypothetical protein
MANMAPQTAYQGSKDMKSYERSKADRDRDKSTGRSEKSSKERASDKKEASRRRSSSVGQASRTIAGKHKRSRVTMSQTPFGGDDIGS